MTQYVLYGGKGGVGKTTCAAATALQYAREGHATLVVSTDPAHSLSDVFDAPVDAEPTHVRDDIDLWAVEIDPSERIGQYRGQVSAALSELEDLGISLDESDLDDVIEAGVAPGTDEAAAMDLFVDYMDDPRYDYIVFDTAPTGHTLRLLKLPDVMSSAMGKLISVRSQMSSLADSVRGFLGTGDDEAEEKPDIEAEIDLEELQARMERVGRVLRDPERTEFRAVLIPETMAVLETERLLAELDAYDIPAGRAIINKVIEDPTPECDLCQATHESQQKRIGEARERFELPITLVPQFHGEVHGLEAIERVADRLGANA
ncbi:ArsA family ATPase [Natronomonas sp.]|uniref:ArsA family ATPase n=1 Tax=Natronomonas sp. TaxID=2184060 RepID=UPI00398923ED